MQESRPIYSWEEGCDYVYGVSWSPVHPAVFASVDGDGRLALWNLNQDAEIPSASTVVEGAPALNRVSFTPTGSHVTVGDDSGKIYLYDVGEVNKYLIQTILKTVCLLYWLHEGQFIIKFQRCVHVRF